MAKILPLLKIPINKVFNNQSSGGGALVKSVRPANGRLVVRILTAKDLSRKNRYM